MTLASKLKTVWIALANTQNVDPAIDVETDRKTALEGYARYLISRDVADLMVKPGEHLTLFEVKRPTIAQLGVLAGIPSTFERQRMAFKYCCHTVKRGTAVLFEAVHPDRATKETKFSLELGQVGFMATDDYVEEIAGEYGAVSIAEVGQVALSFAELSEANKTPFGFWGGSAASPTKVL